MSPSSPPGSASSPSESAPIHTDKQSSGSLASGCAPSRRLADVCGADEDEPTRPAKPSAGVRRRESVARLRRRPSRSIGGLRQPAEAAWRAPCPLRGPASAARSPLWILPPAIRISQSRASASHKSKAHGPIPTGTALASQSDARTEETARARDAGVTRHGWGSSRREEPASSPGPGWRRSSRRLRGVRRHHSRMEDQQWLPRGSSRRAPL